MNGLSCFGTDVRNASTNRLTTVDSQMVVASGMTTSKPAIRSFLRSCRSLEDNGRSGLGLVWTKEPLHPGSVNSDQPNQRSEHRRECQQYKSHCQNSGAGGSTDQPLLTLAVLLTFNPCQLLIHLA